MMAVQAGWPDELGDLEAEELEELLADTAAGGAGAVGDERVVMRDEFRAVMCGFADEFGPPLSPPPAEQRPD